MSFGRLRNGETLAGIGAVGLFLTLFAKWFDAPSIGLGRQFQGILPAHTSGWGTLGWFLIFLLLVAIISAGVLVVTTARGAPVAVPVAAMNITAFSGGIAFLVLLVRVITQPGLGIGAPNFLVEVKFPAYLGLLFTLAIAAGGWLTSADERTDSPESEYTPPPARPAPPAEA
jgi:hypothetical protein